MTYIDPPYTNGHSIFNEDDLAVPAPHTFYSSRPSMNFSHPALSSNDAEPAYTPPPHNELEEGFLRITVTHLDRNRKDPLYKFDVTTNLPRYKRKSYKSVERTYAEFERLYSHLTIVNEECLVPALPWFSTSATSPDEDERKSRENMQRWFSKIILHPILSKDNELREFIESDFGFLPQTKSRVPRRPISTLRLLTTNLGLAAPITTYDVDAQFRDFANAVDQDVDRLVVAGRAVEQEIKARKAFAASHVDLAARQQSLGTIETHPKLANAFRKLGRTLQAISDIQKAQATAENTILADVLTYQQRNVRCVKETLDNRRDALLDLEEAARATEARLRHMERLKASLAIVPDRVSDAIDDLQDAKANEQSAAHRYHKMTLHLRADLAIFTHDHASDLLVALREHAREIIRAETAQLREWERLRPDVAAVTRRQMSVHIGELPTAQGGGGVGNRAVTQGGNGAQNMTWEETRGIGRGLQKEELKDWQFARNFGKF